MHWSLSTQGICNLFVFHHVALSSIEESESSLENPFSIAVDRCRCDRELRESTNPMMTQHNLLRVSCKENYVRAKHISFEINRRIISSEALDVDFYNVDYKQRCGYLSSGCWDRDGKHRPSVGRDVFFWVGFLIAR